jgi:hypothetical protein
MRQVTNQKVTNRKAISNPRQPMAHSNLYCVWESAHFNGKDQLICKWMDASQSLPEPEIQPKERWLQVTVATRAMTENTCLQDEPEPSDFVLHLYG